MSIEKLHKSPMDIAKEEMKAETSKAAVTKLKKKLKELHDAKVIVKNIERELEDLELAINNGIV